jgi:glutamate synthase (NADPH) small chain
LGTSHRQGCASVAQFEIMPRPLDTRAVDNPWPLFPFVYKVTSAHEEGGDRVYSVTTTEFLGDADGNLRALKGHEVVQTFADGRMNFEEVEGSDFEMPADYVFLAMGFVGPEKGGLLEQFGVALDGRGNVARDASYATSVDNVFVAGDMGRGQSLIVWAIAEGRSAAAAADAHLMGATTLPSPLVAAATR